ncbi:hypothetical protein [Psychroflexus salis]|uniref:DUF4292 domain-containing protein n=1 Tax=Psychroflexus salis TaxID=1526574 RepID=A0A916ZUQ6_9FLAO|nr:hypothetical protein [Psychroflexus salis]GGE15178.1 hypothetical protein GCM10010831_15640 [Psychroflexus salis]
MKIPYKSLLFIILITSFWACNTNNSKQEEPKKENKISETKSSEERLMKSVEAIHKKEKFFSEDMISYEISYEFGKIADQLKVKAATDLSLIEIDSKVFGKSYYDGDQLYIDAIANAGDREIKRNFQLLYFYHAFFHLSDKSFQLSPIQEVVLSNTQYKKIGVENKNLNKAFFPKKVDFFIDQRTDMMKGLQLQTSLINNDRSTQKIHLQYDRFITVNHIPVALEWKFYPENKFTEKDFLGEAKVTKIKYYTTEQLPVTIPKNAKPIKNSPLL